MLDRLVSVAAFRDPGAEPEKLRQFYGALAEARRETGEPPVPFDRFARLVDDQVRVLGGGTAEVAFRVTVKAGKVSLTARVLRGVVPGEE